MAKADSTHITNQSLPVPFEHQPELRVLMMFPSLPPGHMTFPVPNDRFEPHLRQGELAVVDMADHRPAHGELFLISFPAPRSSSGLAYEIVQMRSRRMGNPGAEGVAPVIGWTACFWMPPTNREEYQRLLRAGQTGTCDGPYSEAYATSRLVGRIVGIFTPAVDAARAMN